jgi:hypothetical protein
MALTLNNTITAVNAELENITYRGACEAEGDGLTAIFHIAPQGYYIVDGSIGCALDGVTTSAFTMDYAGGLCTLTSTPASGVAIYWQFDYQPWPAGVVEDSIEAAVYSCYPYFYTNTHEDFTPDGSTYEFDISDGDVVTRVMFRSGTSGAWSLLQRKTYEVINDGTHTLRFWTAPATGYMKVFYITRPTLTTIPDRALPAIVSYACYYLITSKMAPRVRTDVAVATQGTGTLSPRQMGDAANAFYMRCMMQLAQVRMQPWSIY